MPRNIGEKKMSKKFVENSARILRNKTMSTFALVLILAITASLVALPTANAHTPPWSVPTWTYVSVSPTTIGVNQEALVVFWLNQYPPTASGAYGDRWTFTVEVTKPDGTSETLGPFTSDPVGSYFSNYVPTQTGTYTFVAKFAEHKITGSPNGYSPTFGPLSFGYDSVNDTYLASTSDPVELTVQEEPIQGYEETPLPTGYWTRPIYEANRLWSEVAGNWLSGAAQNVGPTSLFGYGTGPESAHVMWTRPYWAGGVMDTRFGDIGYYTGMSYETYGLFPPIILNGVLYYNVAAPPRYGWYAVDLRTGEELFFHNTTGPIQGLTGTQQLTGPGFDYSGAFSEGSLSFGQIYNYESPNQHGGFPYLWSTGASGSVFGGAAGAGTWEMFDAFTGNYICSINNVPQGMGFFGPGGMWGTQVYGKDGSLLSYNIVGTQPFGPFGPTTAPYYLQCWNTSRAIWYRDAYQENTYWMWRPYLNYTFDGNYGYSLNASIPDVTGASILAVREDQYVIIGKAGKNNGTYVQQGWLAALNLKEDSNGVINPTMLWNITYTPPETVVPDVVTGGLFGGGTMQGPMVDPEDGVFLFNEAMTRRRWGFSLETGQMLWGPTEPEGQWLFYGMSSSIYCGMLFSYGISGELTTYDIMTGKVLWNWSSGSVGFETPYGNAPIQMGCIADGKLYMYSSEHSPTMPLRRDAFLWCINATDGTLIWKIQCWANSPAIADGYIVTLDSFDNRIYCYGKGPSATTVTASPEVSVHGSSVLIKGTVTDQSAGAKDTPAISDADMEAWMEYLYQQRPMPKDAKGVDVTLDALDPNGNFVHIGTPTSDASGTFGYAFTPEVPGPYKIIATFAGSASYGSSYAETYINVDEAPPTTAPPEYPQPIDNTMIIVAMGIAIIIAVAIVGIWIKRK
jgi:hypothetical protein